MLTLSKSVAKSIIGLDTKSLFGNINIIPSHKGYVAKITPDIAKTILETRNGSNRPISRNSVVAFAKEMNLGNWKVLTDAIAFDVDGNLINGQHRLLAVVMSETIQSFHIFENQPKENFPAYDTGKNRTAGDTLSIAGVSQSASECRGLSSMSKFILRYEDPSDKVKKLISISSVANFKITGITNEIVLNYVQKNITTLRNSRNFAISLDLPGKLTIVDVGGLHYLMSKVNHTKTDKFFKAFSTGANLQNDSPVLHLIKALTFSDKQERASYKSSYKIALVVKAWKMFCEGKSLPQPAKKDNRIQLIVRPTEVINID